MPGAPVEIVAPFPPSTPASNGNDPDGQLFTDSNGGPFSATVHGWTSSTPENNIGTTYEIANSAFGAATPAHLTDIPTGLNTLEGVPNLSAETRDRGRRRGQNLRCRRVAGSRLFSAGIC
jgi:hypothetical protein